MHAGFNAELTDNGQIVDTTAFYSLGWDSFATNVCSQSHPLANSKVVDKVGKTEEFPEAIDDNNDDDGDEENDIDDASMYFAIIGCFVAMIFMCTIEFLHCEEVFITISIV